MILQALVNYYESLAAQGKLAKPGWGEAKIYFALETFYFTISIK